MKASSRNLTRAIVALGTAGTIGLIGACKESTPPVIPPPPPVAAPTTLAATPTSATEINLTWADASNNEDGFKIERCSGAGCTNFAEVGATAANTAAFSNTGLTASTGYSYRVKAFNATASSDFSNTATATTLAVSAPAVVMVGAAEITSCTVGQSVNTAALVDAVIAAHPDAIVFTAGSNVADTTAGSVYADCFNNSGWNRFLPRLRAAVSQRDMAVGSENGANGGGSNAVYGYWGDKAGAPNGWYSYDVGTTWHVIVLNTSTWQFGTAPFEGNKMMTEAGSPMRQWLTADLAANTRPCTMAIFNTRRFHQSSTTNHVNANIRGIFRDLYMGGVEFIVTGTDKIYERYAQQDTLALVDAVKGVRQFIVGTGGRSLDQLLPANADGTGAAPNVEARDASTQGVLKLTLEASSYKWDFIPTITGGYTDTGTTNCH